MKIYKDLEKLIARLEPFADALNNKSSYGNTPELGIEVDTEEQFEELLAKFKFLEEDGTKRLISTYPLVRYAAGRFGAVRLTVITLAPIPPEHVCDCCGDSHGCNGHKNEVAA